MAGAGDGDVAEEQAEQMGMDVGICVHHYAFGGKALDTVAGDGAAVIKMAMLCRVELDGQVVVKPGGNAVIRLLRQSGRSDSSADGWKVKVRENSPAAFDHRSKPERARKN